MAISGAGISLPGDRKALRDRIFSGLVRLLNRRDVEKKEEQYRLFRETGLDWTLVRPPRLANGPRTGHFRVGAHRLEGRPIVSRADLADFMLRELQEGKHIGQAVFIGGA